VAHAQSNPIVKNMILVCGIPQLWQWVCVSNPKNGACQSSSIPPSSHKQKGEGKDKAPTLLCCAVAEGIEEHKRHMNWWEEGNGVVGLITRHGIISGR